MTQQHNQSDNNQEEPKKQKNNHWLKLPTDFFTAKSIKKILKSEKNQSAIIFYLQLSLLTVGTDGYYLYDKFEDSLEEELALELDYSVEKIKKYLDVLEKLQLILRTNDTIFIQFVQNHTGKKDISNERVARYRQRKKGIGNDDVTQCNENCNDDVTQCNENCNDDVTQCNAPRVREELDNREELELDRNHVFFSGLDDTTIDALIQWICYQRKYGKTSQQIMTPVFRKMLDTQVEAGNDIAFSINYTMSIDAKNLIYKPDPVIEAKNKNLSPEERKKQKEDQLKKEDRHNILSNYCRGVTYEEAYLILNKKRKGEIEHYPLRVAEVITKSECDKYMIKYPTRGDWEMLNTKKEGFLLTNGNFLEGDCK